MITRLSDEAIKKLLLSVGFLVDYCENLTEEELVWWRSIAQAQLEDTKRQMIEQIEKDVFYENARGYIALRPNATKNWQELIGEGK